jgi:hypothetical protein
MLQAKEIKSIIIPTTTKPRTVFVEFDNPRYKEVKDGEILES